MSLSRECSTRTSAQRATFIHATGFNEHVECHVPLFASIELCSQRIPRPVHVPSTLARVLIGFGRGYTALSESKAVDSSGRFNLFRTSVLR